MCGRFTLRAPASAVAEAFGLLEVAPFTPRFNIAPTQLVAVVRAVAGARRELAWLRWGLIPSWARDPSIGSRMINARCETVHDKPAYRTAFRRRRCLVVADGFYEWQQTRGRKQPYFIHFLDDHPFGFAGLWEPWEGPGHSAIESCTLLTTTPNTLLAPIHNRMPVIVPAEHYDRWLDPSAENPDSLETLWQPYPVAEMEAFAVDSHVNSPTHDDPKCVERAAG